jgi:hypothetical protein
VTTHEKKAAEALAALTGAGKVGAGPTAAGRLRPASAPIIRESARVVAAAGKSVGGTLAGGGGGGAGGTKEPHDDVAQETLKTYRSAQGVAAAPPAAKRRPASAAARSSAMAPEAGNVLESQAVVQLFQSRRTLLRCLFDHFMSPSGEGVGRGVARGTPTASRSRGPRDPSPPKVAPKPPPLHQAFGGQEQLAVKGALTMAWQLELIPSFVSEQEAAEAFAPGKIRALDHAATLHVNLLEFVRGIGRIALRGFSRGEASSKDFSAAADKVAALLRHIDSQHGKIVLASQAAKLELEQNPLPYSRLSLSPGGHAQAVPHAKHPEILAQQSRAQRQHHDAQLEMRRQMQVDKDGARTRPVSASAKIEKIGEMLVLDPKAPRHLRPTSATTAK